MVGGLIYSVSIFIISVFAMLLSWTRNLATRRFAKQIEKSSSVNEAISIRKRLKWFGILYMLLTFLLIIMIMYFINSDINYWLTGFRKYVFAALIFVFLWEGEYKRIKGNVSIYTKEKYLSKHKQFVLFLRGFEYDKYEMGDVLYKNETDSVSLDENELVYICERYIPTCAIGMTKEGYAPFGADRIYVEDQTWKEDVHELMIKASMIFILVNDRPSCIWEIQQSHCLLDKTIFFVDSLEKYENVRRELTNRIIFPSASEKKVEVPFYVEFVKKDDNGSEQVALVYNFENNEEEYRELICYQLEKRGIVSN